MVSIPLRFWLFLKMQYPICISEASSSQLLSSVYQSWALVSFWKTNQRRGSLLSSFTYLIWLCRERWIPLLLALVFNWNLRILASISALSSTVFSSPFKWARIHWFKAVLCSATDTRTTFNRTLSATFSALVRSESPNRSVARFWSLEAGL